MTEHAKLSPSSSNRWLSCTASIQASDKITQQETTNSAAEEGTKAHQLHEELLLNKPLSQHYPEEMRDEVEKSVAYIENSMSNSKLIVEEWVPLNHLMVSGLTGGTADAIIVNYNDQNQVKSVEIVDYKHGMVFVPVEDNTQLLIYACAVIEKLHLPPHVPIRMTICQPRAFSQGEKIIRSSTRRVDKVLEWQNTYLVPQAKECNSENPTFKPSEKACQWCPVSGQCQAQNKEFIALLDLCDTENLTTQQINDTLSKIPIVKAFISSLEKRVHLDVINGSQAYSSHLKLVKKKIHRKFTPLALEVIRQAFPDVPIEQLHEPAKLLTPAKMEKLLPKMDLTPILQQQPPVMTVAPITDRRKSYSPADDFE